MVDSQSPLPTPGVVGSIYLVLAIVLIAIYVLTLLSIYRDPDLFSLSCYKIMFAIGIVDLLMLSIQGLFAALFSYLQSIVNFTLCKIIGAVAQSSWNAAHALTVLLSFNRSLTAWSPHLATTLFKGRRCKYSIAVSVAVSFGLGMILYCCPDIDAVFIPQMFMWGLGTNANTTGQWLPALQSGYFTSCDALIVLFYVLMIIKIRNLRKNMSNGGKGKNFRETWGAFVPPFLYGVVIVGLNMFFFILPTIPWQAWTSVGVQTLGIFACGINGSIVILFNPSVREQVFRYATGRGQEAPSTTADGSSSAAIKSQSSKAKSLKSSRNAIQSF